MTEFRTEKLSDAQRLHALELRVEELEALVDNLLGAAYDSATEEEFDPLYIPADEDGHDY